MQRAFVSKSIPIAPYAGARSLHKSERKNITPIAILLADDHKILRSGLRELIEKHPYFRIAAEAEDGRMAVQLCRDLPPDVVLMETPRSGLSDLDCARRLMARLPELRIVMFTACAERDTIVQSLMAGALGYIIKPVTPAYLLWAITETAQGRPVLCREAQTAVMEFIRRVGASRRCRTLRPREREILLLLMSGATNKDIGRHLGIGEGTIHWHLDNIFKKLHVHSREAARRKFARGGEFLLSGWGVKTYHFPTLRIRLFSC